MFIVSIMYCLDTDNECCKMNYKDYIKEVQDFPVEGVNFKDISPLLGNRKVFNKALDDMFCLVEDVPDYWVGIDARGFIFASALSVKFGGGILLCRKEGKLPPPTINYKYSTEYSEDTLEMKKGEGSVIIVDDVLATGGTLQAVNDMSLLAGYSILDNIVLIDLDYVPKVNWYSTNTRSLIKYESVR